MIRKAEERDISGVVQSYQDLFFHEAAYGSTTNWIQGLYPTENTAAGAFEEETLYVLEVAGKVCGSMILNQIQPIEYEMVSWEYPAEPSEVLVIHTLCICPAQTGKGYGRQMVAFVQKEAQRRHCKAVRLDTWAKNQPASGLYKKSGFRFAGAAPMVLQGVIHEDQVFFEWKAAQ